MKKLMLPIILMLFMVISSSAQSDAEFDLMERAQMVAEIKVLRAKDAEKDKIIEAQKVALGAYQKLDTVQESRISDLKESLKFRTEARDVTTQIDIIRVQQIRDYQEEITRLRDENKKLRKSRDRGRLIFGALGLLAGKFIW